MKKQTRLIVVISILAIQLGCFIAAWLLNIYK